MKNNDFIILDFDSKLFGFKVAKILSPRLDLEHLQSILQTLREKNVKLVYWASAHEDKKSQEAACEMGGFLADMKVTYVTLTELKKLHLSSLPFKTLGLSQIDPSILRMRLGAKERAPRVYINIHEDTSDEGNNAATQKAMGIDKFKVTPEIIEYKSNNPSRALEALAMEISKYSHFKTDPQCPPRLVIKMYKKWITNSINGKIAKHVLVYKKGRRIAGFITLGEKNGRGDIGLLAVDAAFRGQGIGYKLITAAQKQFLQDNYKYSQVVTQLGNIAACRLYEKSGYVIEKIENFYHFHLTGS